MMNSATLRKLVTRLAVLIVFLFAASTARAQKHQSGGGGSAPQQHSAPPANNNGGSRGGVNTGGGSNESRGSSNSYGSNANRGGNTGEAGGNKSSNPYGEYGKSPSGGAGSNERSNPYGSYGSRQPSTAGGAAGANKSNGPYGSYGNRGGTNSMAGSSRGGANNGAHPSFNNGTNRGANGNEFGRGGNTAGGRSNALAAKGNNSLGARGGNNVAGKGNALSSRNGGPPPGGRSVTRANGDRVDYNRNGRPTSLTTRGGASARFDSHGHVASIRSGGMTINRAGRGRTVITERADHSRLVSMGRGRGFSERPFRRGGHEYLNRTYYNHGRYYARAYRGYYWHGYRYYRYAPAYYYAPGFYGWAYNPWARPVAYGWGWGGSPWYGYYGYYFTPYPVYPSASFWLTDYIVAQNLQAAYDAGAASAEPAAFHPDGPAGSNGPVLTPDVKKAVADEVAAIIAAEKSSAGNQSAGPGDNSAPDALDPAHKTFVVGTALSEQTSDGTTCSLSPGDVITRTSDTPDADKNVSVRVAASMKEDCAVGSDVSVSVDDLQDMHNHLREQVDDGLAALSKNQGKNGLPSGPAGNPQANPDGQAQPDQSVGNDLNQQQQQADQTEKDVDQSANGNSGGA